MKAMKKLRSHSGETLVESLAAILVLTMSMVILASGMSAAAKISSLISLEDTAFSRSGSESLSSEVKLGDYVIETRGFVTENGYYYYE